MSGALLLPPGYHPLINGAVVPSGKLYFYATASSTPQDTYTDADLQVANSNPVQLNATGGLDTHVYGSPTGSRYRMRVYSSADALLDTFDDLLVWGADTATFTSGTFTATLTGMDASTTGSISYRIYGNSAGTGKTCRLRAGSSILGTSNTTALTMTGLPAACQPSVTVWVPCTARDNGVDVMAAAEITTGAPSVITFYTDATLSSTGWTNANPKGVVGGWQIEYDL